MNDLPFAGSAAAALFGISALLAATATQAQDCANRGQLDAMYCDADEDLVADDFDHLLDPVRVLRVDEQGIERAEGRQVVAADVGLLLVLHVGPEPLDDGAGNLLAHHLDRAARRHAEERVQ